VVRPQFFDEQGDEARVAAVLRDDLPPLIDEVLA